MSPSFSDLVPVLAAHGVRFIIIGGVAGVVHGAARATLRYRRRLRTRFRKHRAARGGIAAAPTYLRGAPPGLPFKWDARTVQAGLNFTLTTGLGPIDLLGEVVGGGFYEELIPSSEELQVFGATCRVVILEKLIQLKRAAGRPKDFEAIAELQTLLDERLG